METTRRIALLIFSILITAAIVIAMLIDSLVTVDRTTSAPLNPCTGAVQPTPHGLEFVDFTC
jgi:hypothetical protein